MKRTFSFGLLSATFISVFCGMIATLGGFSFAEDVEFEGIHSEQLVNNFSQVHFTFGGNNYPGGFIRLPSKDANVIINDGTNSITCRKQLRGFYYNARRGNRLRPIDEESRLLLLSGDTSYNDLTISGGVYTNCEGNAYGRYGQVAYTFEDRTTYLLMGIRPNTSLNGTATSELMPSFENFDNRIPLGYIYDTEGGTAFVGGVLDQSCHQEIVDELDAGDVINDIFEYEDADTKAVIQVASMPSSCQITLTGDSGVAALDTMRSLAVKGNVSMSKAMDIHDRKSLKGNFSQETILQDSDTNLSKVISHLKKKSEQICRGKRETAMPGRTSQDLFCIKNEDVSIDLNDDSYDGKTLIVKNGDVILTDTMDNNDSLDLFVNGGNLLLNDALSTSSQMKNFDAEGYWTGGISVTKGLLLQGNFFVNGLILGTGGAETGPYTHRVFLHGKVASFNTPTTPQVGRIAHVENVLGSSNYADYISLENVFQRKCNPTNNKGTDGIDCGDPAEKNSSPYNVINKSRPSLLIGQ